MTSLIDVIFLLLLFFMLSSTFSKFSDVELHVGGPAEASVLPDRMAFLRLEEDALDLNGTRLALAALAGRLAELGDPTLVVSVESSVSAQRLTDLLVALRAAPEVQVILLGEG